MAQEVLRYHPTDEDGTHDSRYYTKEQSARVYVQDTEPTDAPEGSIWVAPNGGYPSPVLTTDAGDDRYAQIGQVEEIEEKSTRADSRVFDVRAYGAVGDGITDDTDALQACADACETAAGTFHIPGHLTCRTTGQIDLRYIYDVDIRGQISHEHNDEPGVLIGADSASTLPLRALLHDVIYSGGATQAHPSIQVVGVKNAKVTVNRTPWLQLYADASDATMDGIAYSGFLLGSRVRKVELKGDGEMAWINQCEFWGGRVTDIVVTGNYQHNHNKWYENNLESSTIQIDAGYNNYVRGMRGEGTPSAVTFGPSSWNNEIVHDWTPNKHTIIPNATVTDSGFRNRVMTRLQENGHPTTVLRIDRASPATSSASPWQTGGSGRIYPGFGKVVASANSVFYLDTGIFPLRHNEHQEAGAVIHDLIFRSDAAIWRPRIYVYDADMNALDGTSTQYISGGGHSWQSGGYYGYVTNVGFTRVAFTHRDVAYARFALVGGSNAANAPFEYAELLAYIHAPSGNQIVDFIRRQIDRPRHQTGATPPARSLLYPGDTVGTDTGVLRVTHRVDTVLASGAAASATTITLTSATGVASGDTIAILLDDGTTHFTTVSGDPVGNDVTLTTGIPSAAAAGKSVATQRWLHIP